MKILCGARRANLHFLNFTFVINMIRGVQIIVGWAYYYGQIKVQKLWIDYQMKKIGHSRQIIECVIIQGFPLQMFQILIQCISSHMVGYHILNVSVIKPI